MKYLSIDTDIVFSPDAILCHPIQRATWFWLLAFCAKQENGGVIRDCSTWKDRTWQQICAVTLDEVRIDCALWEWKDGSLFVKHYPKSREEEIRAKRLAAQSTNAIRREEKERTKEREESNSNSKVRTSVPQSEALSVTQGNPVARKNVQLTAYQLRTKLEGLEAQLKDAETFGYQSPTGSEFNASGDRKRFHSIQRRIRDVKKQMADL